MRATVHLAITAFALLALLVSCTPASPASTPTKPSAPAASTTPPAPSAAPAGPASPSGAATKPAGTAPAATPAAKIKRGGVLRDIDKRTINTLDAHLSNNTLTSFLHLIFDTLLSYKLTDQKAQTFEVGPSLAESYIRIDPTTFEFKLRKGVKFHDGSSFNAAVAKWNLERAANHPKSVVKAGAPSAIKQVQEVDENTLRVVLNAPSAIFPLMMSNGTQSFIAMESKEAVDKMGDDKFGSSPVGTGPMKFREWLRDDRVVLDKFPGHWELGEDGQPLPYVDGEVARIILDPAVAVTELKAGNSDLLREMDLKDIATVRADPQLSAQEMAGVWSALPSFYFNPRPGTQYPFSNNLKLREAAHYATDRKGMADAFGFGVGSANYYPHWFPGDLGYDETLPRREYDLAKAQQLVKDAGFPNGVDLETTVINRPADMRAVEALQAMWAKAGIRMKITTLDRVVWIDTGKSGNFESLSHDNLKRVDPQADQQSRTNSQANWAGYSNPQVDKLWDQAAGEYDINKRAELYKQIQKYLFEDAFHVTGYKWPTMVAINKRVKGYTTNWAYRYVWLD